MSKSTGWVCAHSATALSSEKLSEKLVKDLQSYGNLVQAVLDRSVDSLLSADARKANEVADESEELRRKGESLIEEIIGQKVKFAVPLSRVVESLERTALYSVDIAEIAINLTEKE